MTALRQSHFQVSMADDEAPCAPVPRMDAWSPLHLGGARVVSAFCPPVGRYIRENGRPDVVHAFGALWAGHAALRVAKRWGAPSIVTEVNTAFQLSFLPRGSLRSARRVFAGADSVIAISRPLAERLQALVPRLSVHVIPCTVDPEYWTLPPERRGRLPFLFHAQANLVPRKGIDVLIRAFAASFRGRDDVRLTVGGDGPMRSSLEALAHSAGVAGQTTFLGSLPRDGVRASMWRAAVSFYPAWLRTSGWC